MSARKPKGTRRYAALYALAAVNGGMDITIQLVDPLVAAERSTALVLPWAFAIAAVNLLCAARVLQRRTALIVPISFGLAIFAVAGALFGMMMTAMGGALSLGAGAGLAAALRHNALLRFQDRREHDDDG